MEQSLVNLILGWYSLYENTTWMLSGLLKFQNLFSETIYVLQILHCRNVAYM